MGKWSVVLLACVLSLHSSVAVEVYVVGAGEYQLGPAGNDFDTAMAWTWITGAKNADPKDHVLAYNANGDTYLLANGSSLRDSFFKNPEATGLNRSSNASDLDHCGAWLNAAQWDEEAQLVRGFYHQEWHCNYSFHSYTNKSIAYAESRDFGKTFDKPNHPHNAIITAANFSTVHQTGNGDHGVAVVGDYYYLYFVEWSTYQIGLARAPLSSGGVPGSWKKFRNGQFSEHGIGGNSTAISSITGTAVYYSTSRKQLVAMGGRGSSSTVGRGPRLSSSSDGLHWTMMDVPLVPLDEQTWSRPDSNELYAYLALAPAGSSHDIMADGFYLVYTYLEPNATFSERYQVRKEVAMRLSHSDCRQHVTPSLCDHLPESYALVTLAYYQSSFSSDIWVTTQAVPPHNGYIPLQGAPLLPRLATADWYSAVITSQLNARAENTADYLDGSEQMGDERLHAVCSLPSILGSDPFLTEQCKQYNARIEEALSDATSAIRPVFGCLQDGKNHFISLDKNCSSHTFLRTLGYVATAPALNSSDFQEFFDAMPFKTAPLYSCHSDTHGSCVDVSESCAFCNGSSHELLGYGFLL